MGIHEPWVKKINRAWVQYQGHNSVIAEASAGSYMTVGGQLGAVQSRWNRTDWYPDPPAPSMHIAASLPPCWTLSVAGARVLARAPTTGPGFQKWAVPPPFGSNVLPAMPPLPHIHRLKGQTNQCPTQVPDVAGHCESLKCPRAIC